VDGTPYYIEDSESGDGELETPRTAAQENIAAAGGRWMNPAMAQHFSARRDSPDADPNDLSKKRRPFGAAGRSSRAVRYFSSSDTADAASAGTDDAWVNPSMAAHFAARRDSPYADPKDVPKRRPPHGKQGIARASGAPPVQSSGQEGPTEPDPDPIDDDDSWEVDDDYWEIDDDTMDVEDSHRLPTSWEDPDDSEVDGTNAPWVNPSMAAHFAARRDSPYANPNDVPKRRASLGQAVIAPAVRAASFPESIHEGPSASESDATEEEAYWYVDGSEEPWGWLEESGDAEVAKKNGRWVNPSMAAHFAARRDSQNADPSDVPKRGALAGQAITAPAVKAANFQSSAQEESSHADLDMIEDDDEDWDDMIEEEEYWDAEEFEEPVEQLEDPIDAEVASASGRWVNPAMVAHFAARRDSPDANPNDVPNRRASVGQAGSAPVVRAAIANMLSQEELGGSEMDAVGADDAREAQKADGLVERLASPDDVDVARPKGRWRNPAMAKHFSARRDSPDANPNDVVQRRRTVGEAGQVGASAPMRYFSALSAPGQEAAAGPAIASDDVGVVASEEQSAEEDSLEGDRPRASAPPADASFAATHAAPEQAFARSGRYINPAMERFAARLRPAGSHLDDVAKRRLGVKPDVVKTPAMRYYSSGQAAGDGSVDESAGPADTQRSEAESPSGDIAAEASHDSALEEPTDDSETAASEAPTAQEEVEPFGDITAEDLIFREDGFMDS